MAANFWKVRTSGAAEIEPADPLAAAPVGANLKLAAQRDGMLEMKVTIHRVLLDKINLSALDQLSRAQIEMEVRDQIGRAHV